jgi:hypothetical protein
MSFWPLVPAPDLDQARRAWQQASLLRARAQGDVTVMWSTRTFLLIGHVAFAIVAIGPVTLAVSMFPRQAMLALDDPSATAAAGLLHRVTRTYAQVALAVPVLGVALAAESDYLSEPWVLASLTLFGAAAALVAFGVVPDQRKVLDGADPIAMRNRLHMRAGLVSLAWVAILVLMVAKPG